MGIESQLPSGLAFKSESGRDIATVRVRIRVRVRVKTTVRSCACCTYFKYKGVRV